LEEDAPRDRAFADALANGLRRFANMIGAQKIDLAGVRHAKLRGHLKEAVKL